MARNQHYLVRFEPEGREVEVEHGTPLMRAAALAGLPMEVPCGGLGLCGKCRVTLIEGAKAPTFEELDELTAADLAANVRLACQQTVDRPMVVMPDVNTVSRANQIMVGGLLRGTRVGSDVRLFGVTVPKAPLGDDRPDWSRLEAAAGMRLDPSLHALRRLAELLGEGDTHLAVTTVGGRVVRLESGHPPFGRLGVAIDIGTTTLVCYLHDLETGAELAHAAMLNPQVAHGDDVVSRIHHCVSLPDGLERLSLLVRGAIDDLVRRACQQAGVETAAVVRAAIVGNATMTHILLGINPKGLGLAPFAPIMQTSVTASGAEIGLAELPDATVTVLPNIAGFLGSDTVGVMVAAAPEPTQTTLLVDIGTNGEMVLFHDGKWYGCSAAAGPAFEGARISCGLRGAAGAISRVDLVDDDLAFAVIEHEAPRGICGSGLLDAIALLCSTGVLESTGRLVGSANGHEALNSRLSGEGAKRAFRLVPAAQAGTGHELLLTARDIREVQLAKGSIRASIEALMARAGVVADDIEHVYLAGGFGSYLRVESALRVGLLPPVPMERITAVGNAAGAGARLALVSSIEMELAERLAREVSVIDLANDMTYQMQLVEQMIFPE
ncbi:MAG: DUF4445 domain-containing protein [Armatimonadetes bacterium]|nr:DUF4445 domain-containing protein [Armatimonadota bacterium]